MTQSCELYIQLKELLNPTSLAVNVQNNTDECRESERNSGERDKGERNLDEKDRGERNSDVQEKLSRRRAED